MIADKDEEEVMDDDSVVFTEPSHIVKYHDVFFKFDNGLYRTMLSAVMALCLLKFTVLNDVCSLSLILLIRIL